MSHELHLRNKERIERALARERQRLQEEFDRSLNAFSGRRRFWSPRYVALLIILLAVSFVFGLWAYLSANFAH